MPLSPLQNPSTVSQKIIGLLKGTLAATVLFSIIIFFNVLQVVSVVLLPVSRKLVRKINRELANAWWGISDVWAEHWWKINIIHSGDEVPKEENAFVFSNHQEMSDITSLFRFGRSKNRLGDFKFFVKDPLKYIPGIGWGMIFLDCIFLKRNWNKDKIKIKSLFSKFKEDDIDIWLISFVEGTRLRPHKLTASQEYAKANGLQPLKHVLIPRTKGFVASLHGLREHLDAVYDVTIGYTKGVPTLWQWSKGYVKQVHVHISRHPIGSIPETDDGAAEWLRNRFTVKDQLLDNFYRVGEFEPLQNVQN